MSSEIIVLDEDKNRGHRQWLIDEIYQGEDSKGNVVPNLDDSVIEWEGRGLCRVVYVDPTTKLSTLEPIDPLKLAGVVDENVMLGAGPGYIDETYRLYVNDSVNPHTIAVDSRLHGYGSELRSCKVFLGTNIHNDGVVISQRIDQAGQVISDSLEIEKVSSDPVDLRPIFVPRSGYTAHDLEDGEVVTLVFYNNNNNPVSINKLLVKNTRFIKRANAPIKHVTGIRLESPHLSPDSPNTLEFPLNIPLSSILMEGVVTYSNGQERKVNIDNTAMSLFGIENYVPSIEGQMIPLVLNYTLDTDESTFMDAPQGTINVPYQAVTTELDTLYQVKLYVAPKWTGDVTGWSLRFFLFNMARDTLIEVTDHVIYDTTNHMAFQPTRYGLKQTIGLILQLADIDPSFTQFTHIQTLDITLRDRAHNRRDPWLIDYNSDGDHVLGDGVYACFELNDSMYDFDITMGQVELSDWLLEVYRRGDPLVNRKLEAEAPEPTHMKIVVDGIHEFYRPIEDWRQPFSVDFVPTSECTIDVFWVRETGTSPLQLGMTTFNIDI